MDSRMSAYDQGPNCLEGKIRAQCAIPHPASRHSDRLDRSFSSSKDLSRFSMDGKMDYLYNQPKRKYVPAKPQALSTMNERRNYIDSNITALKHLLNVGNERSSVQDTTYSNKNNGALTAKHIYEGRTSCFSPAERCASRNAYGSNPGMDYGYANHSQSGHKATTAGGRGYEDRGSGHRYDYEGRNTSASGQRYGYGGRNALTSASGQRYNYDGRNGSASGHTFNYEGRNTVAGALGHQYNYDGRNASASGQRHNYDGRNAMASASGQRYNYDGRNASASGQRYNHDGRNAMVSASGQHYDYDGRNAGYSGQRYDYGQRNGSASGQRNDYEERNGSASGQRYNYEGRNAVASAAGQRYDHEGRNASASSQRYNYDGRNASASDQRMDYEGRNNSASGQRHDHEERNASASGQRYDYEGRNASESGQRYDYDGRHGSASGQRYEGRTPSASGQRYDHERRVGSSCSQRYDYQRQPANSPGTGHGRESPQRSASGQYYREETRHASAPARDTRTPAHSGDYRPRSTGSGSQRLDDRNTNTSRSSPLHMLPKLRPSDLTRTYSKDVLTFKDTYDPGRGRSSDGKRLYEEGGRSGPDILVINREDAGDDGHPADAGIRCSNSYSSRVGDVPRSSDHRLNETRAYTPVDHGGDRRGETPGYPFQQEVRRESMDKVLEQIRRGTPSSRPTSQQLDRREATPGSGRQIYSRGATPNARNWTPGGRPATPSATDPRPYTRQGTARPASRPFDVRGATPSASVQGRVATPYALDRQPTPARAVRTPYERETTPSGNNRLLGELRGRQCISRQSTPSQRLRDEADKYSTDGDDKNFSAAAEDAQQLELARRALDTPMPPTKEELFDIKGQSDKKSAFLAEMERTISSNMSIKYRKVMYDVGQDFDVTSGVFVAPHNGVYVFSYQIFPKFMGSFVVDLYKNGRVATRMHVTDMKVGPSDATAVTEHARAGDRYWIQASKGGELHGGPYSFFSATLVADED